MYDVYRRCTESQKIEKDMTYHINAGNKKTMLDK